MVRRIDYMGLQITMSKISSGAPTFFTESNFARPAFAPSRTVRFWDKTGLDNAVAGLTAGDLVKYDPTFFGKPSQPLVIANSSTQAYRIVNKFLSGVAVFDFGCAANRWDGSKITNEYVKFAYTGTAIANEAMVLYNNQNIRIYGGEYTTGNWGGNSIRVFGPFQHNVIMGAYSPMSGGCGLACHMVDPHTGAESTINNNIFQVETGRYSMNPANDPHSDRGTGIHGAILHGTGGTFYNNQLAVYGHDTLMPGETSAGKIWYEGGGGGVIEIGEDQSRNYTGNHYWALGEHLNMKPGLAPGNPGSTAVQKIGGWVILLYGNGQMNDNIFEWIEGNHITGGLLNCSAGGTYKNVTVGHEMHVLHARRNAVRLYPAGCNEAPNGVEYPKGFGVLYSADCL